MVSTATVCSVESTLFFLPILPQWPTSGYTSMGRNSADAAAQAPKTNVLAEKSMKSHGFPGKPEAKSYGLERRKESILLEEGLVSTVFLANARQGSGLYQGSPEKSLRNHSHCFLSRQ